MAYSAASTSCWSLTMMSRDEDEEIATVTAQITGLLAELAKTVTDLNTILKGPEVHHE
jgi:hypothetical protein